MFSTNNHNMTKGYSILLLVLVFLEPHHTDAMLFRYLKHLITPYVFQGGRTLYKLNEDNYGETLTTGIETAAEIYKIERHLILLQELYHFDDVFRQQIQMGKIQPPYEAEFPCNLTQARSAKPPTSVHQVRPGDIDVIATIGESLAAGNGEISERFRHIMNEFRGISFAGGGIGNWRKFLTLPNLLKVYNPKLYGYATAAGLTSDKASMLHMAEPMALSRDIPLQAHRLIARMRDDPNVDMQHHWKLLTIFMGPNDVCSFMCHYGTIDEWLHQHHKDLYTAMTILRENVPRLIVNLVPVPDLAGILASMKNLPWICRMMHYVGCHCVYTADMSAKKLHTHSLNIQKWQNVDRDIAKLPEFQTEDFTVIYQPFTTANRTAPHLPNGDTDLRYFAADCFHFSQRGHASVANSLWNNMFEPLGGKQTYITPVFEKIKCPTDANPYIVTWKNQLQKS